jgi:hypothetical protein
MSNFTDMSSILANLPLASQAKATASRNKKSKLGVVKTRALFRTNTWNSIQEESKFSGWDFQAAKICPTQFWKYGLKYQLLVKFDCQDPSQPEYVRTIKVRASRPQVSFQPIGKWREYTSGNPIGRSVTERRNQQLNVLLVDAQRLITSHSTLVLSDLSELSEAQKEIMETTWPLNTPWSRQFVEFGTQIEIEHLCKAPRILNKFRRGQYGELETLLRMPVPPIKLLEAVLQTGSAELFARLASSDRMPSLNWSQNPKLKGQLHLLGALPTDAKLIFFLAAKQNLAGLEQQIQKAIPWGNLLSEATTHYPHSSAINFLGYHLPCPPINFKPSSDQYIRINLARCAYQYSAGFNLLSPTCITLLEAGAGLEESLNSCKAHQGIALKKYVLQNFDSLRHLLSPASAEAWRISLSKEPQLVKLSQLGTTRKSLSPTESIELF